MNYNKWLNCYTKINSKLNKKSLLTDTEIYDLYSLLDELRDYIDEWDYLLTQRTHKEK